jgi:hypothetical protein
MFKAIKENKILYITWMALILLVALSVVLSSYLTLIALAVFVLFCVFRSVNQSCVLLFGLIPFAYIFKLSPGTTSFFTICEILMVLIIFASVCGLCITKTPLLWLIGRIRSSSDNSIDNPKNFGYNKYIHQA